MNGKEMGGDGGGPDAVGGPSNAPTLDQVYAAIMSQKVRNKRPLCCDTANDKPLRYVADRGRVNVVAYIA